MEHREVQALPLLVLGNLSGDAGTLLGATAEQNREELAQEMKKVIPFLQIGTAQRSDMSRGSKLPESSVMWCWKDIWLYIWVQLSLEDSPHWDSLYMETDTPNLTVVIIMVLYLIIWLNYKYYEPIIIFKLSITYTKYGSVTIQLQV